MTIMISQRLYINSITMIKYEFHLYPLVGYESKELQKHTFYIKLVAQIPDVMYLSICLSVCLPIYLPIY